VTRRVSFSSQVSSGTHTQELNSQLIIMNGYVIAALACLSLIQAQAEPLFFAAPAAFTAAGALTSGSTVTAANVASITAANASGHAAVASATSAVAAANLLGGVVILKGLVIGGLLLAQHSRGRRSAESNDAAFTVLLNAEPAQCYRRLVCDLAAGAVPDNNRILSLFGDEAISPVSPKFEFVTAAKVGKLVKSAATCELRYSCPLSTVEINKILA